MVISELLSRINRNWVENEESGLQQVTVVLMGLAPCSKRSGSRKRRKGETMCNRLSS